MPSSRQQYITHEPSHCHALVDCRENLTQVTLLSMVMSFYKKLLHMIWGVFCNNQSDAVSTIEAASYVVQYLKKKMNLLPVIKRVSLYILTVRH